MKTTCFAAIGTGLLLIAGCGIGSDAGGDGNSVVEATNDGQSDITNYELNQDDEEFFESFEP